MTIQQLRETRPMQIPATLLTIALMLLFPFLIHLVSGPVGGARWLPIFYAAFLAAVLFHPLVGIIAGVVTPLLNHVVTGAPPLPVVFILSFELVVFVILSSLLYSRRPTFWGIAPLAYILAILGTAVLLALVPNPPIPGSAWQFLSTTLVTALPGLLVLLIINWLVVRGVQRVT